MNNTKERNRFLKFAVVGAIGAVIDFGILNLRIVPSILHFSDAQFLVMILWVVNSTIHN